MGNTMMAAVVHAFDQGGQDVKGAAAEPHRLVALKQEPLGGNQPESTK